MTLGREKISFLNTPTPLERLNTVSDELDIELYLKRDDLTNYGTGGNKLRKLEYFVKDAKDKGATMLLTVGGAQTNHGRLTAAVAARYAMKAAIVAVDAYPGVTWKASVLSLSPGTGSEFSILPAQNASGNWVKVVQRVPVRLKVEVPSDSPALRSGMSVYVSVDTGHKRTIGDLFKAIAHLVGL